MEYSSNNDNSITIIWEKKGKYNEYKYLKFKTKFHSQLRSTIYICLQLQILNPSHHLNIELLLRKTAQDCIVKNYFAY